MLSRREIEANPPTHQRRASPVEVTLKVEVVKSEEQLLALREEWRQLESATLNANIFLTFDWAFGWWKHIGSNDECLGPKQLHVLALRREGRLTGLAPFMLRSPSRRGLSVRKLEFLGGTFHDYNGLLFEGDLVGQAKALASHLATTQSMWDVADFRSLPAHSAAASSLEAALGRTELPFRVKSDDPCPFIPIRTDWQGFLKASSNRTRATFRNHFNRLKRLEAEGARIRVIEHPERESDLLRRMIEVENRKIVRGAPGLRLLGAAEAFFDFLFGAFGPADKLYVAVIEKPERLIAYEMGFRCGENLWAYAKAFDSAFGYYSPGTMLIPSILDYGFRSGYKEYDFLRGDEAYKLNWADESHQTVRIQVWKNQWRSRAAAWIYFSLRPRVYRSRPLSFLGFPYVPRGEV